MLAARGLRMGCFCHQSITALQQRLQRLNDTAAADSGSGNGPAQGQTESQAQGQTQTQTQAVAAAASWLAARGLPAAPWQPDPAWCTAKLPTPQLGREEMATLSLLGTLRTQAQSAFGIDPLQPEQATRLTRVLATLNERLTTLASTTPPPDPGPWQRLAAESEAADAVQQAAQSGLLDPSPEQVEAYSQPAGRPMQQWLPLLRQVRALTPLIATARQLDVPLEESPETQAQSLAEAVRRLRSLTPPPPADPTRLAQMISQLSAAERLQKSLGIDPAEAGYAAVQKAVAAKTAAAAALLRQQQPAPPPNLPYCPTAIAPPAVLQAAASKGMQALAAVGWKVPPASALPVLQNTLPATTLAQQMAALGLSPVRSAPCGAGCDAARVMRALG